MGAIAFNNRTLVMGYTGSGKSELINDLFGQFAGGTQRLLFDSKPEFHLEGVTPVDKPGDIDWSQPIIHYRRPAPSAKDVEKLFNVLKHRRRLLVCVHELSDLCEYDANRAPASVNAYLSKGRAFGLGLIGGTQRPVGIPKRAFTDVDHTFIFAGGFPELQDTKAAASAAGLSVHELQAKLSELLEKCGKHAFIHIDRGEGTVTPHAPLSDAERGGIMVGRPLLY